MQVVAAAEMMENVSKDEDRAMKEDGDEAALCSMRTISNTAICLFIWSQNKTSEPYSITTVRSHDYCMNKNT